MHKFLFGFLIVACVRCSGPLTWPIFKPYEMVYRLVLASITKNVDPLQNPLIQEYDVLYSSFMMKLNYQAYERLTDALGDKFENAELNLKKKNPNYDINPGSIYSLVAVFKADMMCMLEDLTLLSSNQRAAYLASEFESFCGPELASYFALKDDRSSFLQCLKTRIAQIIDIALIEGNLFKFESRKYVCLYGQLVVINFLCHNGVKIGNFKELLINSFLYLGSLYSFLTEKLKSAKISRQERRTVHAKISANDRFPQISSKAVNVSGGCYPIESKISQHSLFEPYYTNISNIIWPVLKLQWRGDTKANVKLAQTIYNLCENVQRWATSLLPFEELPKPYNVFECRIKTCIDLQRLIASEQRNMRGRLFASNMIILVEDTLSAFKAASEFPVCFENPPSKSFHQLSVSESITFEAGRLALYEKIRENNHEHLIIPFRNKLLNLLMIANTWLLDHGDVPQFAFAIFSNTASKTAKTVGLKMDASDI